MSSAPMRPLVWLLQVVSSRDAAAASIGDVLEERDARRAVGEPAGGPLWINLQTVRLIGLAVLASAPRAVRIAGLIVRDAYRALRGGRAATLFVVGVLAVGVTAGTVTFSVVDAVLLRPLPLEEPDSLVAFSTRDDEFVQRITPEVYWQLHDGLASLDSMAARMMWTGSQHTVAGVTDEWPVMMGSADLFKVLRFNAAIGRLWSADDVARGETDLAVLGHRFWRDQFDGDPSILGQSVQSGNRTYRIIGVLAADTDHQELDLTGIPIWMLYPVPRTPPADLFGILARMRPGVSTAQVADEIQQVSGIADWRPDVKPLFDLYVMSVRRWMLLAFGAAGLVVLIACANAANLMLTRSAGRARELAIRSSLGASRRFMAATLLAEGLLLSFAATVLGLWLSVVGVMAARTAVTTMLRGVFRGETIALSGRVLLAATAAAIVTGVLVSLVPAWQASRAPAASLLKDAEAVTAGGRHRWRSVFLTAEVATVVVLLVVSWLFVASLVLVAKTELGIDRANLLAVKPRLAFNGTVVEVRDRLLALPGVRDVAISTASSLPLVGRAFGGAWHESQVAPVRADGAAGEPIRAYQYRVTANFFAVAGMPFLRGGTWGEELPGDARPVVLDTEAVRVLFGIEDPLGRVIRADSPEGVFTVVGVVPHLYPRGAEEEDPPSVFFPTTIAPNRIFAGLFVKTDRPADQMLPVVTQAMEPFAPATRDPFVFAADDAVRSITATRRFNAGLMSAFGVIGVLIGAAGVYAVMASFVVGQTKEIGVRLALGATPNHIRRSVLTLAWRHVLAGLLIGLPVAWWLSQGFTALLFQVTPADVSVYAGVAVLTCAVGFLAAWLPARRAARVDPIISLRA